MTLACVMLPKGNSHLSCELCVGMFCGIFPSIGQTVLGDLKLLVGAGAGGASAVLVDAPSSSLRMRPIPLRPARSSAFGCDLDELESLIKNIHLKFYLL